MRVLVVPLLCIAWPALGGAAGAEPVAVATGWVTEGAVVPLCLGADLDAAQAGTPVVYDTTGAEPIACPCQFIPDPDAPLLVWLPVAAGSRRFEITLEPASPATPPSARVTTQVSDTAITVANGIFTVTHSRTRNAGAPDTIQLGDGGPTDTLQMWGDRVLDDNAYFVRDDPAPEVTVVGEGPLACTVQAVARFCDAEGRPAPSEPQVTYRYTYFAGSPLVRLEAVVTQKPARVWSQLHLWQRVYKQAVFPHWVTLSPDAQGQLDGANQTHPGAALAALHDGRCGLGLLGMDARVYDENPQEPGGWGSYLHGPWTTFGSGEVRLHGWLYIGPSGPAGEQLRAYAAARASQRLAVQVPALERRLAAQEQAAARLRGPDRALLRAVAAQVHTLASDAGRFREALAALDRLERVALNLRKGRGAMAGIAGAGPALANDKLVILLGGAAQGFALQSAQTLGADHDFGPGPGGGGLWRLRFRDAEGNIAQVTSCDPCDAASEQDGEGLRLRWRGLGIGEEQACCEVEVRAELPADSALSTWRLSVHNRSTRWGLWEVDFPYLTGLRVDPERGAVAYPRFLGYLETQPLLHESPDLIYPSHAAAMQFSCVQSNGAALYLATYDPDAWYKQYKYRPEGGQSLTYAATHYPPYGPGVSAEFELPYPVVIGAFEGDWIDACDVYRDWALQQRWCAKGPLAQRRDIPQWFRDLGAWYVGGPSDEAVERARALGVPVAIQRYNWHQIAFDDDYPDYFPPKPDFPAEVQRMHEGGIRVVPYINGRLWDTGTESFAAEGAQAWCTKDVTQQRYIENWGQQNHAVMCPTTSFWQEKIAGIVARMVGELDVDGVYIDQVASYYPLRCFDPTHPHAPGDGASWVPGYRQLVALSQERARAVKPEAVLTTEDHAEPFLDLFDGCLTCNSVFAASGLIPMFHHVYSGYAILYGRYSTPPDSDEHALVFRMKNAQMLAWGTQLGWLDDQMLGVREEETAYFRRLAQAFVAGREWLLEGQMLRPGELRGDVPELQAEWHPGQVATMPAIVHSAWCARDGRLGLVFTNLDTEPHQFTCRPPHQGWGNAALGTPQVVFAEGGHELGVAENGAIAVTLQPRAVLVLGGG